jgi:beta-lactamase regulating signal transducer with metallopeptidase domain
MILTILGWAVVHSLWQSSFVAGLTAMAIGIVPERRCQSRHTIACVGLAVMVVAPIATALASVDLLGNDTRRQVVQIVEGTVGLPTLVVWRSFVVRSAAVLWIAGAALCLARLRIEWRRARRLRLHELSDPGASVRRIAADLRRQLSVTETVDVFRSGLASVPMVLGCRRPVIVLPARSLAELTSSQVRTVLAHELAHIKRRDYLTNHVQILADLLLFYHPAARWVSRRIRAEREYCCDDVALAIAKSVGEYGKTLLMVDSARDRCHLAVAAASGTLLDRVQRIAGYPRPLITLRGTLAVVIGSLLASTVFALAMVVPPSLPLDVRMRTRMPPDGRVVPPPVGTTFPRTRRP